MRRVRLNCACSTMRGWRIRNGRLRGLGQDGGDSIDSGGGDTIDFSSNSAADMAFAGDGGGGGGGTDFTSFITDPATIAALQSGSYVPSSDTVFSDAVPGSTVTPTDIFSMADESGGIALPDGSYISPSGQTLMPDGTDYFPDGSYISPDGTYVNSSGQSFPPDTVQAQQAQAARNQTAAGAASSGGGIGGGGKSGGGSGSQQSVICQIFPSYPGCQQAAAQQKPAGAAGSSASSFSKYLPWILAGLGVVVIAPIVGDALAPPSGRR